MYIIWYESYDILKRQNSKVSEWAEVGMNSKLLFVIASLILIPTITNIAYADEQTDRINLCELLGGVWESIHGVCDGMSESFCDTMGGEYQECKDSGYICPLDNPNCVHTLSCEQTCIFPESIESKIPIKSNYPECPIKESCHGHYEQFVKNAPEFRVTVKGNHVYPMSYVLENAIIQNIGFIEENPTLIFNIAPTDDGHLLFSIQSDLFYPMFMHNEAQYIVLIDGKEVEFFQHNSQVIEIPFKKDNYEIRVGGDLHKMDTTTTLYEHLEVPYKILPEDISPDKLTLKLQLDYEINPNDIECPNPDHILTKRTNGKLSCVFPETADKLSWYKYNEKIEREYHISTDKSIMTFGEFLRVDVEIDGSETSVEIRVIGPDGKRYAGIFAEKGNELGWAFQSTNNWPTGNYEIQVWHFDEKAIESTFVLQNLGD